MTAVGIVCEYNPFHRGHLYQIEEIRRVLGAETTVVCAMSGDFVQRGEAAIFDKFTRAEAACRCGADLVVELPLPWCLSSAEGFARGAVGLLGALGATALCFGSETGELKPLEEMAGLLTDPAFPERVKARLNREPNISFAVARQLEAEEICGDAAKLLEQPNDILAIEYLKAIRERNLPMRPLPLLRVGSGHDRISEDGGMKSSSEIRRLMREGKPIEADIPPEAFAVYARETKRGRRVLEECALETAMLSRLLLLSEEECLSLPGAADGLGRRLYRAIREQGSFEEILFAVKTKRYALSRVRRLCLCACLGVGEDMSAGTPPYARVLAANGRGRAFLRQRSAGTEIPILTKPAAVRKLGASGTKLFSLGSDAHNFYCLAYADRTGYRPEEDWKKNPTIV